MKQVKIFVPAKVILNGEYVVLLGAKALASTLASIVTIDLFIDTDNKDKRFYIYSNFFGEEAITFEEAKCKFPNNSLVRALEYCLTTYKVKSGKIILNFDSNFTLGMGTSSAIYLGVIIGFASLFDNINFDDVSALLKYALQAYDLQLQAQTYASGYDIITQLFGGLVIFSFNPFKQIWPQSVDKVKNVNWSLLNKYFHLFINTKQISSAHLIKSALQELRSKRLLKRLYDISESLTEKFLDYIENPKDINLFLDLNKTIINHQNILLETKFWDKNIFIKMQDLKGYAKSWIIKALGGGGNDTLLIIGDEDDPTLTNVFANLNLNGWTKINAKFENIKLSIKKYE